jgi:hypothetical protein
LRVKRTVVFVVGMGRSGTSALARVLSLCGAALPLDVLAPNYGNPTGYWEPRRAVEINDRFLGSHTSSWYDTRLDLQLQRDPPDASAFVDEVAAFLVDGFESDGPLVVKDPRISGLLPYWTRAAARAGFRIGVVQIVRRPDDVAASLARREALPAVVSHALWLKYNLVAERDARAFPRAFVTYDGLLGDWPRVVRQCVAALGLPVDVSAAAARDVGAFLSPALYHHRSAPGTPLPDLGVPCMGRTWTLLSDAVRRGRPATPDLDRVLADYIASGFAAQAFASVPAT